MFVPVQSFSSPTCQTARSVCASMSTRESFMILSSVFLSPRKDLPLLFSTSFTYFVSALNFISSALYSPLHPDLSCWCWLAQMQSRMWSSPVCCLSPTSWRQAKVLPSSGRLWRAPTSRTMSRLSVQIRQGAFHCLITVCHLWSTLFFSEQHRKHSSLNLQRYLKEIRMQNHLHPFKYQQKFIKKGLFYLYCTVYL